MLNYYLRKSHLTAVANKFLAQTQNVQIYNLQEVLDLMSKEEPLLNPDQSRLALATFRKVLKNIIKSGGGVNLPIFNAHPSISGVFDDANTPFDHSKHQVEMNINPSKEFRNLLPTIKVHKEDQKQNIPIILEVLDIASSTKDTSITIGGMIKILGSNIKVAGTDASVGVYLIAPDGTSIKVTTAFAQNYASEVIFICPTLTTGQKYTLEIVTQSIGGSILKTTRMGQFDTKLTAL